MRRVRNGLPIKVSIKRLPDDIVSEEISGPKNEREGGKREERCGREKSHGGYVPEQKVWVQLLCLGIFELVQS